MALYDEVNRLLTGKTGYQSGHPQSIALANQMISDATKKAQQSGSAITGYRRSNFTFSNKGGSQKKYLDVPVFGLSEEERLGPIRAAQEKAQKEFETQQAEIARQLKFLKIENAKAKEDPVFELPETPDYASIIAKSNQELSQRFDKMMVSNQQSAASRADQYQSSLQQMRESQASSQAAFQSQAANQSAEFQRQAAAFQSQTAAQSAYQRQAAQAQAEYFRQSSAQAQAAAQAQAKAQGDILSSTQASAQAQAKAQGDILSSIQSASDKAQASAQAQSAAQSEYYSKAEEERKQLKISQRTSLANQARSNLQAKYRLGGESGMKRGGTFGFRRRNRPTMGSITSSGIASNSASSAGSLNV